MLELAPSNGVTTGVLSGSTPEAERNAGRGLSASQSARAPWRPEPGRGRPRAEGLPGPPRPAQRQRRPQPRSPSTKYKPGRRAPIQLSLPRLRCPLAPRPRAVLSSPGGVLTAEARWPAFLALPAAGAGPAFRRAERPSSPGSPARSDQRRASERWAGPGRGRACNRLQRDNADF